MMQYNLLEKPDSYEKSFLIKFCTYGNTKNIDKVEPRANVQGPCAGK